MSFSTVTFIRLRFYQLGLIALLHFAVQICVGCSLGPRSLSQNRLQFNEAVKTTSEQQLLLNIVRLRYIDTPSSLSISNIADQQELTTGLGIVPFFTSAGAGDLGSYRGSILPQASMTRSTRPTLSYIPTDDEEFTRRLFTPISLEGTAYLAKTTWPISKVLRLYLENLNWVSNAETGSGPTPAEPPEYGPFLDGVMALQRLQDRKLVTIYNEEREEVVAGPFPLADSNAQNAIQSIEQGLELKTTDSEVRLVRKSTQPLLRVGDVAMDDADWITLCQAFKLNPELRTFRLTSDGLDPYLTNMPPSGLEVLDFETRSLLQVLFFVSQGVHVPLEHINNGTAPQTYDGNRQLFDWQQVLNGLFQVKSMKSRKPPPCAHVAVNYRGYWYYIDERDRDTKSTFALLLEVSRLELESSKTNAPILTLPLGGR